MDAYDMRSRQLSPVNLTVDANCKVQRDHTGRPEAASGPLVSPPSPPSPSSSPFLLQGTDRHYEPPQLAIGELCGMKPPTKRAPDVKQGLLKSPQRSTPVTRHVPDLCQPPDPSPTHNMRGSVARESLSNFFSDCFIPNADPPNAPSSSTRLGLQPRACNLGNESTGPGTAPGNPAKG